MDEELVAFIKSYLDDVATIEEDKISLEYISAVGEIVIFYDGKYIGYASEVNTPYKPALKRTRH